ncbi:TlpA family protein disulfide reductase [Solicola gregarius]|uniref:TlpA family protein disulfide reductase n=1 Tax=Solicola gregarius TaxID=2908642 RepID=A0AA46YLR4_9ACTN|nr:TlpA disulfide reductase family protein [Solicola gregarius]UYM06927.1 TlpA family protein disulfide reductase [Solicola gregarius]
MRFPVRRLVVAAALLVAVAGCSTAEGGDTGFISGDGSITRVDAADREDAPTLEGESLEGKQVSTDDFADKTIVVNVWGQWCGPCRKEAPELVEAADELESKNVQFLGLATKSQAGEGAPSQDVQFAKQAGFEFPTIQDYDGEQVLRFVDSMPAPGVPTTWVIDDQGRVAAQVRGETTASTLIGLVEDVQADS